MKVERVILPLSSRQETLRQWLEDKKNRLGLITSIDGSQLITLGIDLEHNAVVCWETPLESNRYPSLTVTLPQCHWYERTLWDLFGLYPEGHPRLKHNLLHETYADDFLPLRADSVQFPADSIAESNDHLSSVSTQNHKSRQAAGAPGASAADPGTLGAGDPEPPYTTTPSHRKYSFMEVKGHGIYEVPVGPIHAGIIEPGHFRFSCLGEVIQNLEIRLGYVHRGVEKRLTELPWKKARFLVEAAASDSVAANALAHAIAIESLLDFVAAPRAQYLRAISLETERVAMHLSDIGGIGADTGFTALSSSMGRLRGLALRMGELLAGTRFQKAYILPGGVSSDLTKIEEFRKVAKQLKTELPPVLEILQENQVARDRMSRVGRVSPRLARVFGLVGVAGRASSGTYDCRNHFKNGLPVDLKAASELAGDVFCRTKIRISETFESLRLIDELLNQIPAGPFYEQTDSELPNNTAGVGIVEAHRGELIHLVFTGQNGQIIRYAIKDPSLNNWTALAIAGRNNLLSDFPLCNKSFSLSYSGHDL